MDITKHEDDFSEKTQISIPATLLAEYAKNKFFSNELYVTKVGSFTNTNHRFRLGENSCPDYLLVFCLNGKGSCETRNDIFPIEANQFMLLSPNQFYRFQADPETPWSINWIYFNGNMANQLNANFDLKQFEKPTHLGINQQASETWNKIHSSLTESFALENINYANLNLYHLISLLLLLNKETKNVQSDEDQLEQSIAYMKKNLHTHLTVDALARKFNYSSSHYSTLFKQKTGLSPIDYFIKLKIQNACQLLNKSNLIVKEVAQKVGYDDPFYFSRMFKKITGKSPIEYKGGLPIERVGIHQFELAS